MSKYFLTYFILALVVFQSAVGIADAHQLHQSGIEHLTFDDHQHAHEHEDVEIDGAADHDGDCHHCCHCHGHLSPAILIKLLSFTLNQSSISISGYSQNLLSKTINPLFRPPIALA